MAPLTFADTYNMVAFLFKSKATTSIKKVNDVVQLRALIDGKKVVVYEDIILRDLHLDDADGVSVCQMRRFLQSLHVEVMKSLLPS
uniref:Uncharacterized protein n=1 Tax=Tanacetum cinerariifolium TaxID=118510 RepID=A0A699Q2F9_TANCI|nr:hypothetical protein [Tanacetum cinerariifolium]